MRCPKCGSFLEEGKSKCFMCGFDTNGDTGAVSSSGFSNSNSGFSTGAGFSTGIPTNTGANMNPNSNYMMQKEAYNNRMNDYRNVDYSAKKGEKKDLIDIYASNKTLINAIAIILVAFGGFFLIRYLYNLKTGPAPKEPIIKDLYFKIDDSFILTDNGNDFKTYIKNDSKGASCSISVGYGSNTSGDHVKEFYDNVKKELEPPKDKEGNITDESKIFHASDSEMTINSTSWHYVNIYYRSDLSKQNQFDILKYRYFTTMNKGFYYDIELALNNPNDGACLSAMENFIQSLEFLD